MTGELLWSPDPATPSEIGRFVAWLLSDAAAFSTGALFFVDGGSSGV